ncbi:carbohydrate ABC transporter permease [uncultured Dysosmobacter sp.]|uniref:carbohydrate ABC transporter permease n=1 Tax=uncultured Dysosmobacter sp. TaxID=2591384 RepID=UPI002638394B|nr:carbohydrate ABC transporter permease [uncultured Dysosmobacter sp.]
MRQRRAQKILTTIIVACIGFLFLLPLLWMISGSLKTPLTIFDYPIEWIPNPMHWENYVEVWTSELLPFWRLYGNSTFIVVFSLLGQLLFASLAAYAFAILDFKGKNILFMFFVATMMIPTQATIIPRFMFFKTIGLYNNLWAIILPTWFNATAIFMLRQFYLGLPGSLVESARIDGASHFRIWAQITMPLTKPAMVSLAILGFISSWNEYLSPLIFLIDEKLYTITQGIRFYFADEAQEFNITMAAATSAVIPILIIFFFCQKYFIQGIATSGMKE